MNVRETCSCGSEFRANGELAVKLLREWRRRHRCVNAPETVEPRDVSTGAVIDRVEDATYPELRIGFRANEWEDDE